MTAPERIHLFQFLQGLRSKAIFPATYLYKENTSLGCGSVENGAFMSVCSVKAVFKRFYLWSIRVNVG